MIYGFMGVIYATSKTVRKTALNYILIQPLQFKSRVTVHTYAVGCVIFSPLQLRRHFAFAPTSTLLDPDDSDPKTWLNSKSKTG